MKQITKKDLRGLKQLFPMLGKAEMRHYVGGYSNGYWNGNWNNPYSYFDYGGYTGYNGYYYDGSGYRLPEVTVYGYYPNHNQGGGDFWPIFPNGPLENPNAGYPYSNGQQGYNGNPGINGNSGYGYYGYYGYYDNGYYGGGGSLGDSTDTTESIVKDLLDYLKQSLVTVVAETAELAHEVYNKVVPLLLEHPDAIKTLQEYLDELKEHINPMVESDPNKMDWEDLFTMWLFELGASNMDINMENNNINFVFGDDAKTTKDLQVQEGVLEARNEAIINIKDGSFTDVDHTWSYDVNEFLDGVITMNTATSFLGSYYTEVKIHDNHDGTYRLDYRVSNISGWESATRLRVSHDHKYHDGIIPNCDRDSGVGLGGTISETWTWSETISL
ncbi:hypothetical protein [Bacteroides sp. 1_1_14]|uniref:hypothetical protein n=1 Tax=Bacteroides sp. 1_1_14 TaxID=469585 RepID=UPI0001D89E16|nr:hypothetical protein [Bacteroides sp. 1_1_14]EFI04106.1 conserved hypothetical protein [Bacteroides sp. 1_1_14]